jgi:hypothetical protein
VILTAETAAGTTDVLVLRGAAAILQQNSMLQELASRCDQPGALHWLHYFLTVPSSLPKSPLLVLVLHQARGGGPLHVDDLRAAVVMFEYRIFGIPTRAFSTDDMSGFRTVVARAEERAEMAEVAANAVLNRGAQFVLLSYCDQAPRAGAPRLSDRWPLEWARRQRPVEKVLPLAATFEATLATLGKSTRFNLGYYRRRLLKKMVCEFVPDARRLLGDAQLVALNAGSLNPIDPEQFALQYRAACDLPGGYVAGLRGPAGEWLSLIGGWRQAETTVLHWQMNAAGYEKDSLGTVMRSFFLEHEVENGARQLVVYGGTTHSMGNSFLQEEATDLVVRRRSLSAALLCSAARAYCAMDRIAGKPNFLARAISRDPWDWRAAAERLPRQSRVDFTPGDHARGATAIGPRD